MKTTPRSSWAAHLLRLWGGALLLGAVVLSQLNAAVTEDNRSMEPLLRAIQERYFIATGTYWKMPANENGAEPGNYPPDGFYTRLSSPATEALWNQALSKASVAISGFVDNPDAIQGAVSGEILQPPALPPITSGLSLNSRLATTVDALRRCQYVWIGRNGITAPITALTLTDKIASGSTGSPSTKIEPRFFTDITTGSLSSETIVGSSTSYYFFPYNVSNSVILEGWTRGYECEFDLTRFPGNGKIYYTAQWYNENAFRTVPPISFQSSDIAFFDYKPGPSMVGKYSPAATTGGSFHAWRSRLIDSWNLTVGYYGPTWLNGEPGKLCKSKVLAGNNDVVGGSAWREQMHTMASPSLVSGHGSDSQVYMYEYYFEGILLSLNFSHPVSDAGFSLDGYVIQDCPGGCPLPAPAIVTAGQSLIDNGALTYYHDGWDYQGDSSNSGCVSCGGTRDLQGAAKFSLGRFHRYRDLEWGASFGPGVMSNFDLRLEFYAQDQVARFFDPASRAVCELSGTDGTYTDGQGITNGIVLKNGLGVVVSEVAQARTAVLTHRDGRRLTFEIFSTDPDPISSGYYCGRLVRSEDLNGFATVLGYQDVDPTVQSENLGMDRMRLWRFETVTDPYHVSANFTWTRVGGQWVITSVTLPNGESIAYRYDTSRLIALNTITYPTGEVSTFVTSWDKHDQVQQVTIDDAGAKGTHRRKTVSLTPSVVSLGGGLVGPQLPNLVRKVVNGAGEISYQNWFSKRGETQVTYLYEGGGEQGSGKLRRNEIRDGKPIGSSTAVSFDLRQNFELFTWQIDGLSEVDNQLRPTKRTATDGTYTTYVRSTVGDILSKTLHRPDGSIIAQVSTTWNDAQLPTSYTDPLGRVTEWTYDGNNNLLSKTVGVGTPEAGTWSFTYNTRGQVLTSTDANNNVTSYVYDDTTGLLLNIIEPSDFPGVPNPTRTFTYDAAGRVATSEDQSGHVVAYEYDGRGRQVKVVYGDATTDEIVYGTGDDANLVVRRKDRNDIWDDFSYDGVGRKISQVRADGRPDQREESWEYLPGKEIVTSNTRSGHVTRFAYDHQMRIVATARGATAANVHITASEIWDEYMATVSTDEYGRRTFLLQDAGGLHGRMVRELVVGGLEIFGDPSQIVSALWVLPRHHGANPAYRIEDTINDQSGQRVVGIDARGIVSTFSYDAQGRLITQVEADQLADGTHNPQAARTEYRYDAQGNQVVVIKPRSFTRLVDGQFELNPDVFATATSYTGRNLVASVTEAAGSAEFATVHFTYTPTGQKASQSDPRDPTWLTRYLYAACCDKLEAIIDPLQHVTHVVVDPLGNTTGTIDPNGIPTTLRYDAHKRPIEKVNGAGEITQLAYDDDLSDGVGIETAFPAAIAGLGLGSGAPGSAVAVIDPELAVTLEIRDGLGRVVRRIDPNSNVMTVINDGITGGLIETTTIDALGHAMRQRADAAGRVREQVDAEGRVTFAAYDAAGNILSTRDPNGVGTDMVHDARNRVIVTTDTTGSSTSMTYDLHGNVESMTDALGKTIHATYDHRDRKQTITDRIQGTTSFGYDAANNQIGITDAEGKHTSYAFDRRGQLEREAYPVGGAGVANERSYTYDPGRRLLTRTEAGVVTTYAHDHANRLISRTYSDGAVDTLGYDHAGRLTQAVSSRYGITIDRQFDAAGRLLTEWQRLDGQSYPVSYGYDSANRTTRVTYPDGRVVTRTFTNRNQLQDVRLDGGLVATRSYDASGRVMTTALGNGLTEQRTYVPDDNLVKTITVPGVTGFDYQYDATKAKTREIDLPLGDDQGFTYDDEQRLTTWSRIGQAQQWTLSKVGDWQTTTRNGAQEVRSHSDVHEVTSIIRGGVVTPLSYDARGNLTTDINGAVYEWDAENRLQKATIPRADSDETTPAVYRYDALGRRLQKRVGSVITTFIHDGDEVVSEWERPVTVTSPNDIASEGDGSVVPGAPPTPGEVLTGEGITRINAQPENSPIPSGYFADKGRPYWVRTNGKTYGWDDADSVLPQARHVHPWPQYDTGIRFATTAEAPAASWALGDLIPGETYAVIVVLGDPLSTNLTNDIAINGIEEMDLDPASTTTGYHKGDFDGYAETITIGEDGLLVISSSATSLNPTLCFVEIGPAGSQITQTDRDRLAEMIEAATDQTGALPKPPTDHRTYVYADGIDQPLALAVGQTRYFFHANHLQSIGALSDVAGQVVERYRYDSYGRLEILSPALMPRTNSVVGNHTGFTGRYFDDETSLMYFRARYYSPNLGRFISRDPIGYTDGMGLYGAYFVPNAMDPEGKWAYSALQVFAAESPALTYTASSLAATAGNFSPFIRAASASGFAGAIVVTALLGVYGDDLAEYGMALIAQRRAMDLEQQIRQRDLMALDNIRNGLVPDGQTLQRLVVGGLLTQEEARVVGGAIDDPNADAALSSLGLSWLSNAASIEIFTADAMPNENTLNECPSPFTEKYLSGVGGRWGGMKTRHQNYAIATKLRDLGYRIEGGGGYAPEEWFAGPQGGTKGGTFVDITAVKDGKTIRVQTVSTLSDGKTMTPSEAAAAARIRAKFPMDILETIPKAP